MHPDTCVISDWFQPQEPVTYLPEPCYLLVDRPEILSPILPNIYLQCEPRIIKDHTEHLITHASNYHTLFTYDHDVLVACPHARFYIVARTWIPIDYYQNINVSLKEYKISTLAGSKCINQSAGHLFRQAIHARQHELASFPITFFRSSCQQPPLPDLGNNPFLPPNSGTMTHKETLFHTFQFAIIIENTRQRNSFSEKIVDCLITKTIPIYYGCENIHQFFDITGWIILPTSSVEDLSTRLQNLHPNYYESYQEIIERNYQQAIRYSDYDQNLRESISQQEYMDRYGNVPLPSLPSDSQK